MFNFAALAGYGGACLFGLLAILLLSAHRGSTIGRLLIAASAISAVWLGAQGVYYSPVPSRFSVAALQLGEVIRDVAWFLFLVAILARAHGEAYGARIRWFAGALFGLCLLTGIILMAPELGTFGAGIVDPLNKISLLLLLILAIGGLVLIEQIYRNTPGDARWAIKHLCFGVGTIFAYDFFLYADAVLFNRIDADTWAARGAVNAIAVPLIGLAAARNRQWELNLFVSRRIVFHSTAVFGAGLYLLLMALAGYYLKTYGGSWGGAMRIAFSFGALLFLLAVLFSAQLRSRLRLFLATHFYQNKYEYGEVWLNFTRALSENDNDPATLRETILSAIVEIMDSTGGLMWQRDTSGNFALAARWKMETTAGDDISAEDPVIRMLERSASVLDVNGDTVVTEADDGMDLPAWLRAITRAWIVIPVAHRDELIAFLVLAQSRTGADITWEDREILRTLGTQAASYLALLRTGEALSEVRQFEAFNRLSAFLVHDLKNIVTQLSLIVTNAERHRDNPEFISDAFTTIGDSISKMNRMLANLRQDQWGARQETTLDVTAVIDEVVGRRAGTQPAPTFERPATALFVRGNNDQVLSVLEHIVQNAQEATQNDGKVSIRLHGDADRVRIEIADSGVGMDREFVKNRLFKPFDTTKGKAGMGIGVYESRHIVSSMGGRMTVESTPGEGTTFRISLPRAEVSPTVPAQRTVTERVSP